MRILLVIQFVRIFSLFVSICGEKPRLSRNIVLITAHKTGTDLMAHIGRNLAEKYKSEWKYIFMWKPEFVDRFMIYGTYSFKELLNYSPKLGDFRAVLVTRHPLDVYISSFRYHRVSDELWLLGPQFFLQNQSYQDYVLSLEEVSGTLFELTCSPVYHDMLNTINVTQHDARVKVFKLEDFKLNYEETLLQMASHLEISPNFTLEASQDSHYGGLVHTKHSSQNPTEAQAFAHDMYEFPRKLKCIHYVHFDAIYGIDSLRAVGYGDSIPLVARQRDLQCQQGYSSGSGGGGGSRRLLRESSQTATSTRAVVLNKTGDHTNNHVITDTSKRSRILKSAAEVYEAAPVPIAEPPAGRSSDGSQYSLYQYIVHNCTCWEPSGLLYNFSGCSFQFPPWYSEADKW